MKIVIMSDIHDHRDSLKLALKKIEELNIDHILHLGDYGSPVSVKPLLATGTPVTGIRGNNDGETRAISNLFERSENSEILGTVYGSIKLDGKKIFMVHYNNLHETVAKSGDYDLVVYGHNHRRHLETIGNTIICNPGAICGNKESASFALYDTQSNTIEHIELQ